MNFLVPSPLQSVCLYDRQEFTVLSTAARGAGQDVVKMERCSWRHRNVLSFPWKKTAMNGVCFNRLSSKLGKWKKTLQSNHDKARLCWPVSMNKSNAVVVCCCKGCVVHESNKNLVWINNVYLKCNESWCLHLR